VKRPPICTWTFETDPLRAGIESSSTAQPGFRAVVCRRVKNQRKPTFTGLTEDAYPIRAVREKGAFIMRSAVFKSAACAAQLPAGVTAGRRYVEPFSHGTMRLGLYAPVGHDPQQPHDQDELYFVLSGSGVLVHEGRRSPFEQGDALYVGAGVDHRFEDFTEDFAAWVVFWGIQGGESD
jgi:mannose-6-phosphate isomerase-like protein (cupin superfamily)